MIHTGIWWVFLGFAPLIYWLILPVAWRMPALALSSLGLLGYFAFWDLLVMLVLALGVFWAFRLPCAFAARLPAWVRAVLAQPWLFWVVFSYFLWAKYLPAMMQMLSAPAHSWGAIPHLAVPLGISYFSFKLLHYVIEQRRGNFPAHGLADFAAWLFLAPIFTAGPIERFEHFLRERQITRFEWAFVHEGVLRIVQGLVKKFVLGWLTLELIDRVTNKGGVVGLALADTPAAPLVVWAALFLALAYVYFDFSGYSDIAIGSARLFGLRIMENFNLPFLATNLQNFWQRWHMTLAHWCRTYIYMTMIGFTRNPYLAVFVTFTLMGLWHSASPHWVLWGMWHGAGLMWLLLWGQWVRKYKITFFKTSAGAVLGCGLTLGYVVLGSSFTVLYGKAPIEAVFRLMGMAFGLAN
jgi:alginate O-acetyltransferase complex protein AlgI